MYVLIIFQKISEKDSSWRGFEPNGGGRAYILSLPLLRHLHDLHQELHHLLLQGLTPPASRGHVLPPLLQPQDVGHQLLTGEIETVGIQCSVRVKSYLYGCERRYLMR